MTTKNEVRNPKILGFILMGCQKNLVQLTSHIPPSELCKPINEFQLLQVPDKEDLEEELKKEEEERRRQEEEAEERKRIQV